MFGATTVVWEKENQSLFEPSLIQWSRGAEKTPSNVTVLHMTNIKRVAKIMIVQEIYNEFYNYVGRY